MVSVLSFSIQHFVEQKSKNIKKKKKNVLLSVTNIPKPKDIHFKII